jgi:hypothetical protein
VKLPILYDQMHYAKYVQQNGSISEKILGCRGRHILALVVVDGSKHLNAETAAWSVAEGSSGTRQMRRALIPVVAPLAQESPLSRYLEISKKAGKTLVTGRSAVSKNAARRTGISSMVVPNSDIARVSRGAKTRYRGPNWRQSLDGGFRAAGRTAPGLLDPSV